MSKNQFERVTLVIQREIPKAFNSDSAEMESIKTRRETIEKLKAAVDGTGFDVLSCERETVNQRKVKTDNVVPIAGAAE